MCVYVSVCVPLMGTEIFFFPVTVAQSSEAVDFVEELLSRFPQAEGGAAEEGFPLSPSCDSVLHGHVGDI